MTNMTRHRTTVKCSEGRYAARCEYEVDGEVQLCNVPLSSFATRTAAREACKQSCVEQASRCPR